MKGTETGKGGQALGKKHPLVTNTFSPEAGLYLPFTVISQTTWTPFIPSFGHKMMQHPYEL